MFSTLKRRISDHDEPGDVQLSLKRKKLRLLPIRTASAPSVASMPPTFPPPGAYDSNPIITLHPDPSTLTPAQSDDEDESGRAKKFAASSLAIPTFQSHNLLPRQQQQQQSEDHVMLDMGVEDSSATPGLLPSTLMAGRIPTPRYGSFFLRPAATQEYGCSTTTLTMGPANDRLVRAGATGSFNQYHHAVENRMLPSPIEEGGRWDTSQLRSSVLSMYDAAANAAPTAASAAAAATTPPSSTTATATTAFAPSADAQWLPDGGGDVDMDEARSPAGYDRRPIPSSSSSPAKPVDRSKGGGGRPTLVMGYRADCEKCKARVPGHYSHIIRS